MRRKAAGIGGNSPLAYRPLGFARYSNECIFAVGRQLQGRGRILSICKRKHGITAKQDSSSTEYYNIPRGRPAP